MTQGNPASHWTDGLTTLPEDARGYFACFALIQNAWNACLNGSWMLRLALALAPDEFAREQVQSAAANVVESLRDKLEPHLAPRSGSLDPVWLAFEDAKAELRQAVGTRDTPYLNASISNEDHEVYEQSLKEIRKLSAELVRSFLPSPAPPARIVPAAFEDTRVSSKELSDIARMVLEEARAAGARDTIEPLPQDDEDEGAA